MNRPSSLAQYHGGQTSNPTTIAVKVTITMAIIRDTLTDLMLLPTSVAFSCCTKRGQLLRLVGTHLNSDARPRRVRLPPRPAMVLPTHLAPL